MWHVTTLVIRALIVELTAQTRCIGTVLRSILQPMLATSLESSAYSMHASSSSARRASPRWPVK
jgi:hypothetical protein